MFYFHVLLFYAISKVIQFWFLANFELYLYNVWYFLEKGPSFSTEQLCKTNTARKSTELWPSMTSHWPIKCLQRQHNRQQCSSAVPNVSFRAKIASWLCQSIPGCCSLNQQSFFSQVLWSWFKNTEPCWITLVLTSLQPIVSVPFLCLAFLRR